MVLNSENYCIPRRLRLLGQATKQPLSNFELRSESLENITNFEDWDLTLVAYKKCNYEFNAVSTRLIKICSSFVRINSLKYRSSHQWCSIKKFLKIFTKLTGKTCARVSFPITLQASTCSFIQKRDPGTEVFLSIVQYFYNFSIFTYFTEQLLATVFLQVINVI